MTRRQADELIESIPDLYSQNHIKLSLITYPFMNSKDSI
jgi:hypothetical protein